jgi:hypothetical protein
VAKFKHTDQFGISGRSYRFWILFSFYTLTVFIYLFAYGIKILGVPVGFIFGIFSGFYILAKGQLNIFLSIWRNEFILLFILYIYLLCIESIVGQGINSKSFGIYIVRIFIDGLLPILILKDMAIRLKLKLHDFALTIVIVCNIEFLIAGLMIYSPHIKTWILTQALELAPTSKMMSQYMFIFRGFGLAWNYLVWFPFALGLMFIFVLFTRAIHSRTLLILFAIQTMLLIGLNARIGFVPFALGILGYLAIGRTRQKLKKAIIPILFFIIFIYILNFVDFGYKTNARLQYMKDWVLNEGFLSFFNKEGSQTIHDLSNYNILSQLGLKDWILGHGVILTPEAGGLYTDVGYLQTLYTGGLILSGLLYTLFCLFFYRLHKLIHRTFLESETSDNLQLFSYIFAFSLAIGHYKLRGFELTESTKFLFLLISFFMASSQMKRRDHRNSALPH